MDNQEHICEQLGRPRTLLELYNSQNKNSCIQTLQLSFEHLHGCLDFILICFSLSGCTKCTEKSYLEMQIVRHKLKDDWAHLTSLLI